MQAQGNGCVNPDAMHNRVNDVLLQKQSKMLEITETYKNLKL